MESFTAEKLFWESAQNKIRASNTQEVSEILQRDNTKKKSQIGLLSFRQNVEKEQFKRIVQQYAALENEWKIDSKRSLESFQDQVTDLAELLEREERRTYRLQINNLVEEKLENQVSQEVQLIKPKEEPSLDATKVKVEGNEQPQKDQLAILKQKLEEIQEKSDSIQKVIDALTEERVKLMQRNKNLKNKQFSHTDQDVTMAPLYLGAKKRAEDVETKWISSKAQLENTLKEYQELQVKKRKDMESKKLALDQEHRNQEEKVIQAEARGKKLNAERDKLLFRLDYLKSEIPRLEVINELNSQVGQLQASLTKQQALDGRLRLQLTETRDLIEERKRVLDDSALRVELEKKTQQLQQLKAKLTQRQEAVQAQTEKLDTSKYKIHEQKTLMALCQNPNPTDIDENGDVHSATAKRDKMKQMVEDLHLKYKALTAERAQASPNSAHNQNDAAKTYIELTRKLSWKKQQIATFERRNHEEKIENEYTINSITEIETGYLHIQEKRQHLDRFVQATEDTNMALAAEVIKYPQAQASSDRKVEAIKENSKKAEQKCAEQALILEQQRKKMLALAEQIRKMNVELINVQQNFIKRYKIIRDLTLMGTDYLYKLSQQEKEMDGLRKVYSANKSLEAQIIDEKENSLRLIEEKNAITKRIEHYAKNGGTVVADPFQVEQLENYKRLIRCTVCGDRAKNTVIMRCFHVFCYDCLMANLQRRHRKCPGCAGAFANQDIQVIELNQ